MSLTDTLRNVKLNPVTLLLVVAGAAIVAYVVLGASFLRQRSDRDALSSQLESAAAVLATANEISRELEELPTRLEEAKQELLAAETAFPTELDSDSILQTILNHANASQVRVLEAHARPPAAQADSSDGEAGASGYLVLGFDLKVEGTFEQLFAFLVAIEEGATSTSTTGVFSLQESEGRHVLSLEVLSYARSASAGDTEPEAPDDSSGPATDAGADQESPQNEASP